MIIDDFCVGANWYSIAHKDVHALMLEPALRACILERAMWHEWANLELPIAARVYCADFLVRELAVAVLDAWVARYDWVKTAGVEIRYETATQRYKFRM